MDEQVVRYAADLGRLFDEHERLAESHAKLERLYRSVLDALAKEKTDAARTLRDALVQAEAARLAKQTFIANMSHELRTPLNAIMGMSYLASRGNADPALRRQLTAIADAGQRLLQMVTEILDTANLEAGQLQIEVIEFSLPDLLDGIVGDFASLAQARGFELQTQIDPEIPARLRGDPLRIGQVLRNLVDNALKFSMRGPVVLRVKLVNRVADMAGLLFEVEDRGIGICESDREKVFALFEQADGSSTRRFGGSGLGLSVCKLLVELMDGKLGYQSLPDEGSLFWVTLRLPVAAAATSPAPSEAAELQQASVMGYLYRLLAIGDFRARRLCIESGQTLRDALGARADDFFRAIDSYDFAAALKIHESVQSHWRSY